MKFLPLRNFVVSYKHNSRRSITKTHMLLATTKKQAIEWTKENLPPKELKRAHTFHASKPGRIYES